MRILRCHAFDLFANYPGTELSPDETREGGVCFFDYFDMTVNATGPPKVLYFTMRSHIEPRFESGPDIGMVHFAMQRCC